jgi:hypothetical protein
MMTKFEDSLFGDLMREHGAALSSVRPVRPRVAARPVWLTGGAIAAAGVSAAGVVMFSGGGVPAFAVTQNHDGTATLALHQMAGIAAANAKLRALGDNVVIVPVQDGCVSITSLPPAAQPVGKVTGSASNSASDGSLTLNVTGIPAGDLAVIGADQSGGKIMLAMAVTSGPAPSCVSIPAHLPGNGPTQQQGSGSSSGGPVVTGTDGAQEGSSANPPAGNAPGS